MDTQPKLRIGDRFTDRGGWTGDVIRIIDGGDDWLYEMKSPDSEGTWIIRDSQVPPKPVTK